MTPQSTFMIVAPIAAGDEGTLRGILAEMNRSPGRVDAANALVPFAAFERLHFARFVILDDRTGGDVAVYGLPPATYPTALAFVGDCDGDGDAFLAQLAASASAGLRRVFGCCGLRDDDDLLGWMRAHATPPAAVYVNRPGRAAREIRENAALARAIDAFVARSQAVLADLQPEAVHARVRAFVDDEIAQGRLSLSPRPALPLAWRIRNAVDAVLVPLVLLVATPLLLIYLPFFAYQLRSREARDPEVVPPVEPAHAAALAAIEDFEPVNQFSAIGTIKPGLFRQWTLTALLFLASWATRHVYVRGRLGRVHTIHAARWVFLDGRRRVFFASNYDGSLESYMEDFINKVGWGLNLVFSNGIGYPSTRWLVLDGAKDEQKFKAYIRRHQLPTEVWYNGHDGVSAYEIERHNRIREGIEHAALGRGAAAAWCALL